MTLHHLEIIAFSCWLRFPLARVEILGEFCGIHCQPQRVHQIKAHRHGIASQEDALGFGVCVSVLNKVWMGGGCPVGALVALRFEGKVTTLKILRDTGSAFPLQHGNSSIAQQYLLRFLIK